MKKRVEKCYGQGEETKMKKQKKVEPPAPSQSLWSNRKPMKITRKKKANQGGLCMLNGISR